MTLFVKTVEKNVWDPIISPGKYGIAVFTPGRLKWEAMNPLERQRSLLLTLVSVEFDDVTYNFKN